jgi:hypothetical protein
MDTDLDPNVAVMTIRPLVTTGAIIFATSMSASYAGPCSQEIDRMQAKIDAKLEARAAAGSSAAESTAAIVSRRQTQLQPLKPSLVTYRLNE